MKKKLSRFSVPMIAFLTFLCACSVQMDPQQKSKGSGLTMLAVDNLSVTNRIICTVDPTMNVKPISPYIYGINYFGNNWSGLPFKWQSGRIGGNRWTAYNWENNASCAGADWYNQNDGFLGGGNIPGEAVRLNLAPILNSGAAGIITVPVQGYVAADKLGGGDVNQTPDYLSVRFKKTLAFKGSAFTLNPDVNDAYVYQDEFVNYIKTTFPESFNAGTSAPIFFSLDNEPDLWSSTHSRIQTNQLTYQALHTITTNSALAIKSVVPNAIVFGPVSYGFSGFQGLQGAPDANGRNFINYYLDAMKQAEIKYGKRLIDVLDIHWYPEARGGGVRITEDDATDPVAVARIQAPRTLWDETYTEDSWIGQWFSPVKLILSMKDKISTYYPGTKLAITEYYYGGGDHISGAIAQADVLGIFGQQDVFAANLWHCGNTDDRSIYGGFSMYLNYDGAGNKIGTNSVSAVCDNSQIGSIYGTINDSSANKMHLVAINKTNTYTIAEIKIGPISGPKKVTVYDIDSTHFTPKVKTIFGISSGSFQYLMPPLSVSTFVIEPAPIVSSSSVVSTSSSSSKSSSSSLSSLKSSSSVSWSASSSSSRLTTYLPGKIEAENYFAMSGIQTESCSEGTLNVGWIDTGDWLDYQVVLTDLANAGSSMTKNCTVNFRVACISSTGSIDLSVNGVKQFTIKVPNTGGWQTWTTISTNLNLTSFTYPSTVRLYASGSPWNLNYFDIKYDLYRSSSSSIFSSSSISSFRSSSKSSSSIPSSSSSSVSTSSSRSPGYTVITGPVQNFSATPVGPTAVRLSCGTYGAIDTTYSFYMNTEAVMPANPITSTVGTPNVTITNLSPSTTYYFWAKARCQFFISMDNWWWNESTPIMTTATTPSSESSSSSTSSAVSSSSSSSATPVLKVQFYNGSTALSGNQIYGRYKLVNTGTQSIALSAVKIRYYYTADGTQSQSFWCDWSQAGSGNVTGSFVSISPAKTTADKYLEIGFTSGAGNLAPGATLEIQTRNAKSDWSNYNQGNDYSFNATATSYTDWNKVTAFNGGTLQWGVEP